MALNLDEILNFPDEGKLNAFIESLAKVNDSLEKLAINAKNSASTYNAALASIQVSAQKLESSIDSLDAANKNDQKTISAQSKAVEELVLENEKYSKSLAEVDAEQKSLANTMKQLTAAKVKLEEVNGEEINSVNDLKKKLSEATKAYEGMGDATDQAIKESALKNVSELSKQYKSVKVAVDEAKKSVALTAGSYNELSKKVSAAKKELKNMEGGLEGNSQEFKDLQKFVAEGTASLKEWDKAIGDNQREVGNYEGAVKSLKDELKLTRDEMLNIAQTLGTDSEEFAKASEKAGELKDQLNDLNDALKLTSQSKFETLSSSLKDVGSKLLALDFGGALQSARAFAQASKSITFKEAAKGLKDFGSTLTTLGKAILTNPLFLLTAVIGGIIFILIKFRDKIKPIAIVLDVMGQVINRLIQSVKDFSDSLGLTAFAVEDMAERSIAAYIEMEKRIVEFYDKQIELAQASNASVVLLEIKKQEAIAASAKAQMDALDKLKKANTTTYSAMTIAIAAQFGIILANGRALTDEQKAQYEQARKDFVSANNTIKALEIKNFQERQQVYVKDFNDRRDAAIQLKIMLLEISSQTQQRIIDNEGQSLKARRKAADDNVKTSIKIARLEAKQQIDILNEQLSEVQRLRESELRLVQDYNSQKLLIESKYDDDINEARRQGAYDFVKVLEDLRKKEIDGIKTSAQQEAEINKRYDEEQKRVATNISAQVVLIKTKEQKEISDAQLKGSQDRFKILESELNFNLSIEKNILDYEKSTFEERIQALFNFSTITEEILDARLKAGLITQEAYNEAIKNNERATTDALIKLQLERNAKLEEIDSNKDNSFYDDEINALNESYNKGLISTREYNKERRGINYAAARQEFEDKLFYLEQELDIYKKAGMDISAIEAKISQVRADYSQRTTDKKIADEERFKESVFQLQQETFDFAQSLVNAGVEREIADSEAKLQRYSDEKDRRLAIVGEDAQARAAIEEQFAAKQKEIQAQIQAQKRKAAIFDKARASTQIVIDTARAIMATLAEGGVFAIPLTAVIAAIGGLQLAKVLSAPIPAFAEGTDYSPKGWALVGEAGREIGIDPSGKQTMYDKPTVAYLKQGTKIINNEETEKALAMGDITKVNNLRYNDLVEIQRQQEVDLHTAALQEAIEKGSKMTVAAIKSMPQDVYDEKGYRQYERSENGRIHRLNTRFKL